MSTKGVGPLHSDSLRTVSSRMEIQGRTGNCSLRLRDVTRTPERKAVFRNLKKIPQGRPGATAIKWWKPPQLS